MPISGLCEEHRQLEDQARHLMEIVMAPVADAAAVAGMRWEMAKQLREHCAREDQTVYRLILASGDAAATKIAWAYRQEHGQLGTTFGRYITDWPVARINRQWEAFRADTIAILDQLAVRIASEEATLYAHAERLRLRRAA
ncbi:MAG: hemerythrin domain-containing protein [Pseudomonadota bacterium]